MSSRDSKKAERERIKREMRELSDRVKREARDEARRVAQGAKREAREEARRITREAREEAELIWARPEPGNRKPRFTREDLAAKALEIADADGYEAVSMRRLASELGAGTMTLYHYVRTKDELLMLMDDAIMGEVLIPEDELATGWRAALTQIATSSYNAFQNHPWAFEAMKGAGFGPNGMRHFEQSMLALSEFDWTFAEKLELITLVDDYVFGHFVRQNEYFQEDETPDPGRTREALEFMTEQIKTGDYPEIARMLEGVDIAKEWGADSEQAKLFTGNRFDRGLEILLDGVDLEIKRRNLAKKVKKPKKK